MWIVFIARKALLSFYYFIVMRLFSGSLNSKLHTIIFGTIVLHYYDSNWLTGEIDVGSEYNGKFPIVSLDYVAGTANGLVSAEVVKNGKFTVWMQGSGYVSAHVASISFIIL